ncbi:MAG: chemotaxis protein CheB [Hydrocarboniphaga sp.]|uniref:chemotaxis protein CheB n=1 Tax=Hydrocarboniphaga sp. TaxID=2033016 RepID=UPI002625B53D|nr:chemotaxis protein CheB [Hydrocarboniphaga sp.]MDB5971695.1 chemotaxis protein CheB [Hydrocarboniphaga sp.]
MTQAAWNPQLIAIGGSAGSLDVLRTILPRRSDHPLPPIVIVVHVPAEGPALLHELLGERSSLAMKQADDKELLQTDHVYFAPPGYHLLIEKNQRLALSVDPAVNYSRPSIDVLFESAANACGSRLLAVLLSGASEDGARGMAKVTAAGGRCAIQTPESASSPLMPAAALERVPLPSYLMSPDALGELLAGLKADADASA